MASTAVLTAMGVDNEEFIVSAVFMRCENDQLSGWSPSLAGILCTPSRTLCDRPDPHHCGRRQCSKHVSWFILRWWRWNCPHAETWCRKV